MNELNEQTKQTEPLTIKVKYHTDIDPLQQIAIGDAIDVRAAKDIHLLCMAHLYSPQNTINGINMLSRFRQKITFIFQE